MFKVENLSNAARRAALFRHGGDQALRIPKVFELPGNEVIIYREDHRLVIEPVPKTPGLLAVLAALEPCNEEFPDVDSPTLDIPLNGD